MSLTPGRTPLDVPQHMTTASPNLMDIGAAASNTRESLASVYDTSAAGSDAGGAGGGAVGVGSTGAEEVFVPSKETGEAVGAEMVTSSVDGTAAAADGLTNASDQLGYLPWELVPQVQCF